MKSLFLHIFLFVSSVSITFAETIFFKTHGLYYKLNISNESFFIQGHLIDLSFVKKDCNKNLIESFNSNLKKELNNKIIDEKDYHLLNFEGKDYKVSKSSRLGSVLYNLPKLVIENKKKESFLCRHSL